MFLLSSIWRQSYIKSMQTKNAEIVMKLLAGCIACMRNSLTIAFLLSGLKKRRNIGTTNHNTIFLVSDLSSRQNWNRKKLLRNIRNKFQTLNTFFTAAAMALLIPFKKTFAPSYSWCFIYIYYWILKYDDDGISSGTKPKNTNFTIRKFT